MQDEFIARRHSPPAPAATDDPSASVESDIYIKDDAAAAPPAIDGYYSMNVDAQEDDHESCTPTIVNRLLSWYSLQIDNYPVTTKSAFGGCSAIVGDMLAQCIENNTALREEPTEGLYARRILAMFCSGLCFGPMLHYIYEFYEHVLPIDFDEQCLSQCIGEEDDGDIIISKDDSTVVEPVPYFCHSTMFHSYYTISNRKNVNAFLHVAIDQGIMAFAYVAVLMVVTGVVEGRWSEIGEEFAHDYINNVHAMWLAALMFTGPIQIVAFRYLPLKYRTLAVNVLEVFEVMVMSWVTHRNREVPNQA
jgi:hypothetical protein